MNGHGEKLSRKQESAIAALLTESTIAKAAKQAGVSERTLRNWLDLPRFQEAFREARAILISGTLRELRGLSKDAISALKRNLRCGNAAVEVGAARTVLDQLVKYDQIEAERLAEVESQRNPLAGIYIPTLQESREIYEEYVKHLASGGKKAGYGAEIMMLMRADKFPEDLVRDVLAAGGPDLSRELLDTEPGNAVQNHGNLSI